MGTRRLGGQMENFEISNYTSSCNNSKSDI